MGKFIKSSVKRIRLRNNFVWGVKWKYKFKEITVQPFCKEEFVHVFFDGFANELKKADTTFITPVFAAWSETGKVNSKI